MKTILIGTLAHVDAGKTTLTESMLYATGGIRQLGRVDHGDAFLDFDSQERDRGITIFSKQAIVNWKDIEITLLDTPGHVDFSTEMERTLQILDYAIVVINGLDGIQAHTETIWNLLKHYQIPTFLFVNKMDIAHAAKEELMLDIKTRLDERCTDFTGESTLFFEQVALTSEERLEYYLQHQELTQAMTADAIQERAVFPCYFGSALKMNGIESFLNGLTRYTKEKQYPQEFGAKVYKITRDENGNRLTHMKITGGSLKVKTLLYEDEKVDQLRKYSGSKYQVPTIVYAGDVCAVKGLRRIQVGEGLGIEHTTNPPVLCSFMNYRIILPVGADPFTMLKNLQQLVEEDPQLHVSYHEQLAEIRLQVMGEIQIEILQNIIKERFHIDVEFDQGSVNYKETIAEPIEGIGHYEPLRHYAEVHVLLEPGERGSGLQFRSECSEDVLDRHWQRQILSHLEEKEHLGVLSGSPITDIKITLLGGKAHLTHTEGGDFRQATYRAVRQGLKAAKSVLLEPYYHFRLEVPNAYVSKAIYDIEVMHGNFTLVDSPSDVTILVGSAPVVNMQSYPAMVRSYTKGMGTISCTLQGYEVCQDEVNIIEQQHYDSEKDLENPTGSIFCTQGAGFFVPWNEVEQYMHIPKLWIQKEEVSRPRQRLAKITIDDKELERVFTSIYGTAKRKLSNTTVIKQEDTVTKIANRVPEYLLVDGYNIIYSWDELKELAASNVESARRRLIDIMCNYQGFKQCTLILVFDAYKVRDNIGTMHKEDNIFVVYTKTMQTADAYIEQIAHELACDYRVVVATSDAMVQLITTGQGARRMSARELKLDVVQVHTQEVKEFEKNRPQYRNHALEDIRKLNDEGEDEKND